MLVNLEKQHIASLSQQLRQLPKRDRQFFNPHTYDIATIELLLGDSNKHYYLYYDDTGNFAGYGMVRGWEGYDLPTIGCVIWPQYRHRGNGAKLVKELIEQSRELGYRGTKLKVSPKNRAAYRLYKRFRFIETGEVTHDGQIWMETGKCEEMMILMENRGDMKELRMESKKGS